MCVIGAERKIRRPSISDGLGLSIFSISYRAFIIPYFSEAVSCEAISGSRNNHKEITRALDFTDVSLGNPKYYLSLGGPKKILSIQLSNFQESTLGNSSRFVQGMGVESMVDPAGFEPATSAV